MSATEWLPPKIRYHKAPEPSAALLALQEKGLELTVSRKGSISPPMNSNREEGFEVSPLSIISVDSGPEQLVQPFLQDTRQQRRESTAESIDTTITQILNLYTKLSKNSLRSEYEKITPHDDDSDEDQPLVPTVHQPKAYRDTIAPLLQHQFSGDKLVVPTVSSPVSVSSTPMLSLANKNISISSLEFSSKVASDMHMDALIKARLSQTSIQRTPDTSPITRYPQQASLESQHRIAQKDIQLEVPDVREAGFWYGQLNSPITPEEVDLGLRRSDASTVPYEDAIYYQRQMTLEALVPPKLKVSASKLPVHLEKDNVQADSIGGVVKMLNIHDLELQNKDILSQPLSNITQRKTASIDETKTPTTVNCLREFLHSHHASVVAPHLTGEHDRASSTSLLNEAHFNRSPYEVLYVEEPSRPGSALSKGSFQSHIGSSAIGRQLKQIWKTNFGTEKERRSGKKVDTKFEYRQPQQTLKLDDSVDSYKYPYWKLHGHAPFHSSGQPSLQNGGKGLEDMSIMKGDGCQYGLAPSRLSSDFHTKAQSTKVDIQDDSFEPLFVKHDNSLFAEPEANGVPSNLQTISQIIIDGARDEDEFSEEGEAVTETSHRNYASTVKEQTEGQMSHHDLMDRDGKPEISITDLSDAGSSAESTTPAEKGKRLRTKPSSQSRLASDNAAQNMGGTLMLYNNDLFEASGGVKRRSGLASRFMMSSHEKRKRKVKESIIVLGSEKMGTKGRESQSRIGKDLVDN